MRCIYCDRLNPPCKFIPIMSMTVPVLGQIKTGGCCHDCDKRLRTDGRAYMAELSYAARQSSDT